MRLAPITKTILTSFAKGRILPVALVFMGLTQICPAGAADTRTIAFLGVHLQNDNAGFEPTSDAERARMAKVEELFKSKLEESHKFDFVAVPAELNKRITAGQAVGACGGCELEYGKELGAQLVAWINVQKVSNLILNMNVYMADVSTGKLVFLRSVDIRGNTDESWTRSIALLVKNYLLPTFSS
ncbi:MAG: DUF3280 domain-containing protein [Hyphomicrobium sp.]|nr:DUF3280 domain-containing protein [Hyphomicrobium sp.]